MFGHMFSDSGDGIDLGGRFALASMAFLAIATGAICCSSMIMACRRARKDVPQAASAVALSAFDANAKARDQTAKAEAKTAADASLLVTAGPRSDAPAGAGLR